jgi:5'(3')-deoxyribonucleotidase
MIIYLDMDDVVADWFESAQNFLGQRYDKYKERIPESDWNRLKSHSRFYRLLPLKPGAKELVAYCQNLVDQGQAKEIRFLTALPRSDDMPWAVYDKVMWAQEHFPNIPVFIGPYSDDKWKHCEPGDILIDDRTDNCAQWENAGGLAHVYRNWPDCQAWLETVV